jgi:hypothetical protein
MLSHNDFLFIDICIIRLRRRNIEKDCLTVANKNIASFILIFFFLQKNKFNMNICLSHVFKYNAYLSCLNLHKAKIYFYA